ncbi:MAG: ATP-NAD kinase [OM182 bacterium]|nr:MAG: ATP-NAD kinase [OM182 bacterium]
MTANGESSAPLLRIGLVVNPLAGIGGAVGLQGSDGEVVQRAARERDGKPRGEERLSIFLLALRTRLGGDFGRLAWCTWGGVMGAQILSSNGVIAQVAGEPAAQTSAQDTQLAVKTLGASDVDLLIFVGGDGTARDVLTAADEQTCVLGLPAGVKMHSGVFAISPSAAADVVAGLAQGSLVGRIPREVRDYVPAAKDATNAKHQAVATKRYGELWVPEAAGYLQQMKVGGKEDEGLVVQEIVSFFLDHPEIYSGKALVMGPGSTCLAIKQALGLNGALLGCDVLLPTGEAMENATSADLLNLASQHTLHVLVSFTRHQGFLLGRGNQQLSAEVLHALSWKQDVTILGSRTKLATLDQRPMLVDTGDARLDQQLSGLVSVLTGYDDFLLYRVSNTLLPDS